MRQFILVCLLVSQQSFAGIYHSNYEEKHLEVIEKAIKQSCNISTDALIQKSNQEEYVQVDNGLRDIYFTTVLETQIRIDQNAYKLQKMIVKSVYHDSYEHLANDWGVYSVDSVNCNPE